MLEADITFLIVILSLAVIFTICVFIWKGIIWMSLISGVLWVVAGAFFMIRVQEGVNIMMFQEYMGMLLIGIAIVMFFSPMWLRAKSDDIERNAPEDIDIWNEKSFEHHLETRKEKEKRLSRENKGGF